MLLRNIALMGHAPLAISRRPMVRSCCPIMTKLRDRFLGFLRDRLVPPLRIDEAGGPAFFAYASHKSAVVNGRYVCPLIETLIKRKVSDKYTYIVIGAVGGPEEVKSTQLPHRLNVAEFVFSLFFLEPKDFSDFRFLKSLFDSPILCLFQNPSRIRRTWVFRRGFALRSFLLANYFALKFRKVASECDSAYVLVYYNAIMLGVVRAFRRAGKRVWDVQHGYNGINHPAYNNANAFSIASSVRPSGFLVWDRKFGEQIESALGAPWESTDYMHLKGFGSERYPKQRQQTILYSLQTRTPVPLEVEKAVRYFRNVEWIFRMHPADRSPRHDLDCIRAMANATVTDTSEPLAALLGRCDLHVTFHSGALHEAAVLGVRTLILDDEFLGRAECEVNAGLARFVPEGTLIAVIKEEIPGTDKSAASAAEFAGEPP